VVRREETRLRFRGLGRSPTRTGKALENEDEGLAMQEVRKIVWALSRTWNIAGKKALKSGSRKNQVAKNARCRKMGETLVKFKVYGPNGRFAELEALVDTGATFTKIPKSIASKLGLQAKYATDVELGDKRIIRRQLALGEVEIEDVRRPVLIAIGGDDERPIIGYTTLELLGFKINPITGKLEKTFAIEY